MFSSYLDRDIIISFPAPSCLAENTLFWYMMTTGFSIHFLRNIALVINGKYHFFRDY
jgi:hypothetical protein